MASVTTSWKHIEERNAKKLVEHFDTDREARESFNSAIHYYTSCAKAYEFVDIVCEANGRSFNFNFSNGE